MITMKKTLTILKNDSNLREIVWNNHFYFDWQEETFNAISYDSRNVSKSTLFFAKGREFNKSYLEQAISDGLQYYVSEIDYELTIPVILVNDIKQAMSLIAQAFYDYPQNKLKLLAFTGTKGKTTAAYYAYHILKQNHRPALLSTMNTTLDGKTFFKSALTTPESIDLLAMMAQAVKNGRTHLIMEVSSQAYLMKRVYGITFDVGVFLNISPDHIGPIEHPTFEDYFYHKRLLLENSRFVVINHQMDHFDLIREQVANQPHEFYGKNSDNTISKSQSFSFEVTGKLAGHYDSQLIGHFNQENALASALAAFELGASLEDIKKGIAETVVPGRMEVLTQTNGARVFVDYAHNGVSLKQLLSVVTQHQTGQIVLIIGATGNKGESRRKDFGEVINQFPQIHVILTSDDPNYEDPIVIAQEIASHITRQVDIIADRKSAIKKAMTLTNKASDAVVIAGKGADAYQIVDGQKVAYEGDIVIAKNYL
ncbi:UDP-N-acetylmuramoyl-L-alanyl-D-glutamate--L-lysine ligase [Streptococcus pacificus]|uniref:UDP-N-acetylmuramoyl-L-alanyl-D-glutamate--L-lysine ligase n=1 Tax=Streptococcus pacificus TaxID=2740577 RepID=A0ABS0ZGU6_9STRE|nr:UDP-N-acetylmuramoyl-L-alanyl-D-glutamate--L-lysine ligase [Streptococcus pacificus]MBJ8325217.1 UDP-N-acetylmuramoyl-L-alanyl-D-glutamate--L-lysine ligase [Streptococcus pacificus]